MESNTKNALIAGVAGLAVGAIAGILLAPAKGSDTRAAIAGKAEDIKDKAIDLKDRMISNTPNPMDILSSLKSNIESSLVNGKAELKDEMIAKIKEIEATLKKA
jgi:gas vesicle protein